MMGQTCFCEVLGFERLCPPNIYVETLTPNVMVLGGGAFWRWLCYEGRVLINGISAPIEETPQSIFVSLPLFPSLSILKT